MNRCYLGIGSNQKHPERQLLRAIHAIKALPFTTLTRSSKNYWNPAWGMTSQQDFCNRVVEISTRLTPQQLLKHCQTIEKQQGRIRKKRWGPRIIDIDILWYGGRAMHTDTLILPHPFIMERDFVIKPLLEINPGFNLEVVKSGNFK